MLDIKDQLVYTYQNGKQQTTSKSRVNFVFLLLFLLHFFFYYDNFFKAMHIFNYLKNIKNAEVIKCREKSWCLCLLEILARGANQKLGALRSPHPSYFHPQAQVLNIFYVFCPGLYVNCKVCFIIFSRLFSLSSIIPIIESSKIKRLILLQGVRFWCVVYLSVLNLVFLIRVTT